MKRANIFDPIQKGLDQKIFNGIDPRSRVIKYISEEMQKVLVPILGFDPLEFMDLYLTGSLTTYQYGETSDCDISVFVQWDLWPTGDDPNTIRRTLIPAVMNKLDGSLVPGTQHPIQHFVVPPGTLPEDLYKPGLRSAWSFRDKKWLVHPEKDRVHDISVELPVLYHRAEMMADKMEVLLEVNPIYAKEFWHQIHRKRTKDQNSGKGDFSEGNIIYKYLLHNGYFDRIRDELGERIAKVGERLMLPVKPQSPIWHPQWDRSDSLVGQPCYCENGELGHPWNPHLCESNQGPISGNDRRLGDYDPDYDPFAQPLPEGFQMPQVGSIWTVSDPWAGTKRNAPSKYTVKIIEPDDIYGENKRVEYIDLDTNLASSLPVHIWAEWVTKGRAWSAKNWTLDTPVEDSIQHWPDTLPDTWSFVREAATQRLFIAFDPPDDTIAQIIEWQQQNLPEGARPHPASNLHMTLAFLGDTEEEHIPELAKIIAQLDPSAVTLSGPTEYKEIRGKQGVLVWDEQGGNDVWRQLNQLLYEWNGFTPQYDPWLPHTTVWEYPEGLGEGAQVQLPVIAPWRPIFVGLFKSEKNPDGGGIFTRIATKTADDLSWVDKSTPYGTPDGGFIGGPEHPGDDPIGDQPRSLPAHDFQQNVEKRVPLKVIYDFDRDQIILGDKRVSDQFPPGQIIGEYHAPDVYLNDHAEAWFNPGYFKRLWQHSFPKREINRVILDKGEGHHEVVHSPEHATMETHGKESQRDINEEDQAGLELSSQAHDQAQPQGIEALQVIANQLQSLAAEMYGEYSWPTAQEIMQGGIEAVESTGQSHPGFRQGAEGAIDSARGAAINRHVGVFGSGGSNDPYDLASHLIWRVQSTQMAIDGNKRMGTTAGLAWLAQHGYDVSRIPQDDGLYKTVEAASEMEPEAGADYIAQYLRQYVPEEK